MYKNYRVFLSTETDERFVKVGADQFMLEDDFLDEGGHVYNASEFETPLLPTGDSIVVPQGI